MKTSTILTILIVLLVGMICCLCLIGFTSGAYYFYKVAPQVIEQFPTELFAPTPTVVITRPPVNSISTSTLETLRNTIVPENDLGEISCRLLGKCNIPLTLEAPSEPFRLGAMDEFWVSNIETNENRIITATLHAVTPHVYFWIENGVEFDQQELQSLVDAFEYSIYPKVHEFFGGEWSPGVDGDEHIYILYATDLSNSIAGYYSAADERNPLLQEYSNGHEMFVFNADNSPLNDLFTYGVLAHEFLHMVQWNVDRNESSWLNEGFSELSAFINGYEPGGFDLLYLYNTDLQLNDWPNDENATTPHYGSGFLFTTYFLDRFGEEVTHALFNNPLNGLESIDDTLTTFNIQDPQTGKVINADNLMLDWAVTNYLVDGSVGDGRYTYHNYPQASTTAASDRIYTCPQSMLDRPVHQYGVDYIEVNCTGEFTLRFEGSTAVRLLPADPYSGEFAFWSNRGDESAMTLTHQFDLTALNSPVTFTYHTWFDIEEDFDYLYLEASTDGENWTLLNTTSGRGTDPTGNNLGWGYTGVSGNWIEERIDLSEFAGQTVWIRFEYVTDGAVNGEGFLLDDLSLPALGYFSDLESDDGGWQANGFVRIQNSLPQTFNLALILQGDSTMVETITLNSDQTADIPLNLSGIYDKAVLVVIGTQRETLQLASYRIEIK